MAKIYAKDFFEILEVLPKYDELRKKMIYLIKTKPIQAKVTEEYERQQVFREILINLIDGEIIDLKTAYEKVEKDLSQISSKYIGNSRIFSKGWPERHVRTQLSRFYNQVVLEILLENDFSECFIPHSSSEDPSSKCTQYFACTKQNTKILYDRLIKNYEIGDWDNEPKIPDHPYCTHVVYPLSNSA